MYSYAFSQIKRFLCFEGSVWSEKIKFNSVGENDGNDDNNNDVNGAAVILISYGCWWWL